MEETCNATGIEPAHVDFALSEIYESEPWGYDSPNMFLNQGMRIAIPDSLSPYGMLGIHQSAESAISNASHRQPDGSYADRLIDIDFIAMDDEALDSAKLILPIPTPICADS